MAKPIVQALLVADRVYEDRATNKRIIAGVFNQMLVFPKPQQEGSPGVVAGGMNAGSPYAYMNLTEVSRKESFTLRYVHLNSDRVMFEASFSVECRNPLASVEVTVPLPDLPRERGTYALELLCDDEPLGSFRIQVTGDASDGDRSAE